MCNETKESKGGSSGRKVSNLRWFQGLLMAGVFSLSYILSPIYILTSIISLVLRYPNANASFIYASPLILSIFTPSMTLPWLLKRLKPMLDYFEYEQIFESEEGLKEMTKGKNFIIAAQPHGVISFCGIASSIHAANSSNPEHREHSEIRTAVASSLLKTPILKNVMGLFNLTDASSGNLRKILKEKGVRGSIVIYIGGIAELFKCSRKEERLYLLQRKGFIKLALREGVDIVPVYLFGNTSVLSVMKHGVLANLSRKSGVSLTWFWGKFNLPIPRDEKLLYVAGKPLGIPKIAEPTQEDIDKWHTKYCDEVRRIFETHKGKVDAYKNKELFID
jgi:1-acyl-sn-glycerol-3-phosphate acyltransferase